MATTIASTARRLAEGKRITRGMADTLSHDRSAACPPRVSQGDATPGVNSCERLGPTRIGALPGNGVSTTDERGRASLDFALADLVADAGSPVRIRVRAIRACRVRPGHARDIQSNQSNAVVTAHPS